MHVLSPTERDGLESLLFDPVLLFALVVREKPDFAQNKGLVNSGASCVKLPNWALARWQLAVDSIQSIVLGPPGSAITQSVEYLNDLKLGCLWARHTDCSEHIDDPKMNTLRVDVALQNGLLQLGSCLGGYFNLC